MNVQTLLRLAPVTFILLVLIVGYALLQMMLGVSIDSPNNQTLLRFGANFLPKTLDEPWRLISSGFLHIGLMHLLFNSFALYSFGQVAEPAFGKWRFLLLFLLSVVAGNLLSLAMAWQAFLTGEPFSIAAGASGGIMGIGVSLIALSFSRHPFARSLNKNSLVMVMAANLVMGFAIAGIDNAAHIGGAICGGILGAIFAHEPLPAHSALTKKSHPCYSIVSVFVATAVLVAAWFWLQKTVMTALL